MLFPNKAKYRKWQTGRKNPFKKVTPATRGTKVRFGEFALIATKPARITSNQIESSRKVISRTVGKFGKYWIRVFPDRPVTKKAAEVGMGKGKGNPEGFCAPISPGRILFEVGNVTEEAAREALRKAGAKMPMATKVISKSDQRGAGKVA